MWRLFNSIPLPQTKKTKNTRSCTDNDIDFAEFSFSRTGILHDRENPWQRPKAQGTTAQLIHEFKQKTRTYLNHRTIAWALVENHQWVCDREGSHHRYQTQLQTTACRFGKIKKKRYTKPAYWKEIETETETEMSQSSPSRLRAMMREWSRDIGQERPQDVVSAAFLRGYSEDLVPHFLRRLEESQFSDRTAPMLWSWSNCSDLR